MQLLDLIPFFPMGKELFRAHRVAHGCAESQESEEDRSTSLMYTDVNAMNDEGISLVTSAETYEKCASGQHPPSQSKSRVIMQNTSSIAGNLVWKTGRKTCPPSAVREKEGWCLESPR